MGSEMCIRDSSITEVATIEHNTSDASYNSLIQVDSDNYVLAYSGTNEDGFIATFSISSTEQPLPKLMKLNMIQIREDIIQLFKLIQILMPLHMRV